MSQFTQLDIDRINARRTPKARVSFFSDCCESSVEISTADEGTQCYVCQKCRKPCNYRRRPNEGCEDESELHSEILQECRRRGWLALHGSMAHKAKRTLGEPDFIILREPRTEVMLCGQGVGFFKMPEVLFIEAKTRTGKLSPAQNAIHAHARKLGHVVHVVRDFKSFLEIIK